ncbi:MAG: hypothetical protein K2X86_05635 [Cytophagaceae bacterium]|nr:hypothetical protein [Cytophagaceae bacterium]
MKNQLLLFLALLINGNYIYAQVAPFSIPPKWYYGKSGNGVGVAGMNFMGGAPVNISGVADVNSNTAEEAGTTMVDSAGNVTFYTVTDQVLYNSANTNVSALTGYFSSTQGAIAFPDPASPFNQYYLVIAACELGGNGLQWYRLSVSGPTVTILSGPNVLQAISTVTESVTVSTDGNYGYWIVAHATSNTNYYSWNVTAAGVGARVTSTGTINGSVNQGSLKISKCQNRIAFVTHGAPGSVEVYNWNKTTGTLGALVRSTALTAGGIWYGCEFSPDETKLYMSNLLLPRLDQYDLSTGVITNLSTTSSNNSSEIGTMQLGPDGKIYVVNGSVAGVSGNVYHGVINNPNTAGAGCGYVANGYIYMPMSRPVSGIPLLIEEWPTKHGSIQADQIFSIQDVRQ